MKKSPLVADTAKLCAVWYDKQKGKCVFTEIDSIIKPYGIRGMFRYSLSQQVHGVWSIGNTELNKVQKQMGCPNVVFCLPSDKNIQKAKNVLRDTTLAKIDELKKELTQQESILKNIKNNEAEFCLCKENKDANLIPIIA